MFRLTAPCRKLLYNLTPLPGPHFLETVFSGLLETLSPGLDVLEVSEVKSLSRVRLFATPWTVAYQDPQSMGFSRHEYWSGLPFPSPGSSRTSDQTKPDSQLLGCD